MKATESMLVIDLAIMRAKAGALSRQALLWVLAASPLTLPTPDSEYDGKLAHFRPLLVQMEGLKALVVFTDPRKMGRFSELAPQFIQLQGRDVIEMMPGDTGIVVNPDTDCGFEIPPQGLAAIRDELRLTT